MSTNAIADHAEMHRATSDGKHVGQHRGDHAGPERQPRRRSVAPTGEAVIVTRGYLRQNIIEEVWAKIVDVDQSTISRYITLLTPLIERATAEFRPSAQDAAEATRDAIALVDGTLWPCWSWAGERELWAGKYKTTGHGSLNITNLADRVTFVSEPVPGKEHDMAKPAGSECEMILKLANDTIGDKDSLEPIASSLQFANRKAAIYTRADMTTTTRSAPYTHPSSEPSPT